MAIDLLCIFKHSTGFTIPFWNLCGFVVAVSGTPSPPRWFLPLPLELHCSLPGRPCPPVLNPRAPSILVFISFFFQFKLSLSGLTSTPKVILNILTALTFVFSLLPSEFSVYIQHKQFKVNMQSWTHFHLPASVLLTTCSFTLYNCVPLWIQFLEANSQDLALFSSFSLYSTYNRVVLLWSSLFFPPALLRYN